MERFSTERAGRMYIRLLVFLCALAIRKLPCLSLQLESQSLVQERQFPYCRTPVFRWLRCAIEHAEVAL